MIIGEKCLNVITKRESNRIIRFIQREIINTNISRKTFDEIVERYDDSEAYEYGVYTHINGDYSIDVEKFLNEIDEQKDNLDDEDLEIYLNWEKELLPYRDYQIEIKDNGIDSIKETA